MEATGERYLPDQMNGQIKAEHLNRYYFVTTQFDLKEKTVLDIASGEGYGSNILAQHLNPDQAYRNRRLRCHESQRQMPSPRKETG